MFLVNYEDRLPRPLRLARSGRRRGDRLSIYDVMGRAAYAAFMAWSVISVCYFVVIAALCSLSGCGARRG